MRVIALVLLVCCFQPRCLSAQELSDAAVLEMLSAEQPRDVAIRKGLSWLRDQQLVDGSLVDGKNSTALTSMAIIAHLAAGHALHDPAHGPWLQRSLRYVLAMQSDNGYFGKKDHSRMYGHGITTLMLAEALGMCGDIELEERMRLALERALTVTVAAAQVKKSGQHRGGWRYQPHEKASDLSLSGWQLMSLHAAQQVGISVPEKVIEQACDYGKGLVSKDGKVGYSKKGQDHHALRGTGLLCFSIAGEQDNALVDRIRDRIIKHPIEWKGPWLYYRAYYDAVGLSRTRPDAWNDYRLELERVLVEHQHADGHWPGPPGDNEMKHGGPVYTTAMAILALAVDRHVLPAYQR